MKITQKKHIDEKTHDWGKNTLAEKTWLKNTQTSMVEKYMDEKHTNFDG